MSSRLISFKKENAPSDITNLLSYINSYVSSLGLDTAEVDLVSIHRVIEKLNEGFPYAKKPEVSFVKKTAAFLTYFVQYAQIKTPFPYSLIGQLCLVENHQNTIIGLDIAFELLGYDSHKLSTHRYIDIIDALSNVDESQYRLICIFLEQIYLQGDHASGESSNKLSNRDAENGAPS